MPEGGTRAFFDGTASSKRASERAKQGKQSRGQSKQDGEMEDCIGRGGSVVCVCVEVGVISTCDGKARTASCQTEGETDRQTARQTEEREPQKLLCALCAWGTSLCGSGLPAWMTSGNLSASWMKKTGI
jgi:hypothetical protein